MSFIPKFGTPCELAEKIPGYIAELMDADQNLQRRFREETVSDLIVACIKMLPTEELLVVVPDEKTTGSDFDIIVATKNQSDAIQFRIQAKRLTPHDTKWEKGSYRELAHPHNSGQQASTLVRSSAHEKIPTIPLYAFYNQYSACEASDNLITGLELASGRTVNELIKEMVRAKPRRIPNKRLETLRPLFFPITTLLCAPFEENPEPSDQLAIPHPTVFSRFVNGAIFERDRDFLTYRGPEEISERLIESSEGIRHLPSPSKVPAQKEELIISGRRSPDKRTRPQSALPVVLQNAVENRDGRKIVQAKVKRPRIVLISKG